MTLLKIFKYSVLAAGVVLVSPQFAQADGDAEEGKKYYNQCRACHLISEDGQHRVGPNLYGIFGQEAGSQEGFRYSSAMKESGIVWNEETLDAYLENPRQYIPGNRMGFVGVKDEERREDLIAYLKEATQAE